MAEEIKEKNNQEIKQIRVGHTITTSVSVSKEIKDLIDNFKISPTEAFRKGVAVSLAELHHPKYSNELNQKRLKIIKNLDSLLKLNQLVAETKKLITKIERITMEVFEK